jgi:hypothetical protein
MYGLSKDWCASGLRLGVLYTRNRRLHQSLDPISVFAGVSNFAQWAVAQALDDADWAAAFLRDNARLLEASYDVLAGVCVCEGGGGGACCWVGCHFCSHAGGLCVGGPSTGPGTGWGCIRGRDGVHGSRPVWTAGGLTLDSWAHWLPSSTSASGPLQLP